MNGLFVYGRNMFQLEKPLVLTVTECAYLLKEPRTRIYELLKAGILVGVKIGVSWRVRTSSVEEMLKAPIPKEFFEREKFSYEQVKSELGLVD